MFAVASITHRILGPGASSSMHGSWLVSTAPNSTPLALGRLAAGLVATTVLWVVASVLLLQTAFRPPHLRLTAALNVQIDHDSGDEDSSYVYSHACPMHAMCRPKSPQIIVRRLCAPHLLSRRLRLPAPWVRPRAAINTLGGAHDSRFRSS